MDFLDVVVFAKFLKQRVCGLDFSDFFGPEKGWQTVLPKVMEALDLPLCLWRSAAASGNVGLFSRFSSPIIKSGFLGIFCD